MKMQRSLSQLLVIDIQERLAPAMTSGAAAVELTQKLLRCASRLGVPVTITEQYRKGIGLTLPGVVEAAGPAAVVFEKMSFSALGEEPIATHLRASRPMSACCRPRSISRLQDLNPSSSSTRSRRARRSRRRLP